MKDRAGQQPPWTPRPVDTEDVKVPESLYALIEVLAENAHDNWARRRLSEGWRYGPCRSDSEKTHPLLIPYADLSHEEQEADRVLALETVKLILRYGYTLHEPAHEVRGDPAGTLHPGSSGHAPHGCDQE
ncbi:RyR domain-containing protein [Streptomyces phyllanthi]|uniref:Ryanodine receptor Ryr n=1 Tax=Streptomyces phyllanthi TaxID=1803180 RepID=A0A5N8WE97_9ACTN|nr:RyR domain-containing protein [Streptomyces phyllanthi]MPY45790.1 Ryanodine receptor Ryr [Streptomyces phyllanthi]